MELRAGSFRDVHTFGAVDIGNAGGTGAYTLTGGNLDADGGMNIGTTGGVGTYTTMAPPL